MARRVATEDDWEDDEPEDFGNGDDLEYVECEADEDPTIPCPHCQEDIYDQTEQCPHCGKYFSEEDPPASRKPLWIVITAIVCLCAVLFWIRN
jgi:hypothetical protein